MSDRLDGKVALITGAGQGMGRSHAVLMADRGADIIVNDINEDNAETTARMVRERDHRATVIVADVTDVEGFTTHREHDRNCPLETRVRNCALVHYQDKFAALTETAVVVEQRLDQMGSGGEHGTGHRCYIVTETVVGEPGPSTI